MTEHDIEIAIARELMGEIADHEGPRHTGSGPRHTGSGPRHPRSVPGADYEGPLYTAISLMEAAVPERVSRAALLAELEDVRLAFEDLRHALASPQAKTARITGRWTALDVVAHLASWAAETRREMERLLARIPFDYTIHFEAEGGPRAWNQRQVDDRGEFGLSELVDELNTETERLADLVLSAPPSALQEVVELPRTSGNPPRRWHMPLAAMVLGSCWHARLHLRRLLEERNRI